MFLARDFFPVWIIEHHFHVGSFNGVVVVLVLINPQANAFVLNNLAGTINRAIGEKNRLVLALRPVTLLWGVFVLRHQFAPIMADAEEVCLIDVSRKCEKSIVVGCKLRV